MTIDFLHIPLTHYRPSNWLNSQLPDVRFTGLTPALYLSVVSTMITLITAIASSVSSSENYVNFSVSVEDILSFEVRHKYQTSKGKVVTSSGRVLQELGKTYPDATSLFNRCFESSSSNGGDREDYVKLQSDSPAERKVLWIRVALVEGNLQGIVEQLLKKPR